MVLCWEKVEDVQLVNNMREMVRQGVEVALAPLD